ncbi:MAG: DUF4232 domain-containing protein [Pseudonocardiaceae bacterium]|nr:DUF4232 domain-containing protein [Pseudonocardiaceae bacterium]
MTSGMRTMTALAVSGLAIAGLTAASNGAAVAGERTEQDQQVPACQGADLSVGKGETQAGMHQRGMDIVVTNTAWQACSIDGYPTVTLLDADHNPVRTNDEYGSTYFKQDPGARRIVLEPGENVASNLAYTHPTAPDEPQVTASHLRIHTPGATEGEFVIPIYRTQVYRSEVTATALAR